MDPSDPASFEASASRRPEFHALTWLALGSLSTAFPMCDTMLHGDDFPDVAGERELLRSIFLGSFMAAMWSLPSHLTDEEKRSLFETVKRVHGHRFIWTTAVGVFAAVPNWMNQHVLKYLVSMWPDWLERKTHFATP